MGKPEDVIGYPVIFNDKAIVPVIGDFRYARLNYDIGTIFETDKDGKAGRILLHPDSMGRPPD